MFRDGATKILRENSTFLIPNPKMPVSFFSHIYVLIIVLTIMFCQVMWHVEKNIWYCKSGNEEKRICDEEIVQLHTDMTDVVEAIK